MIRIAAAQHLEDHQGLIAGGLGVASALGGYKYLRRFQGSNVPALRQLQDKLKDVGVDVVTHAPTSGLGAKLRRALYGAPDISAAAHAAKAHGHDIAHGKGVLHHSAGANLPVKGVVDINAPDSVAHMFGDKGTFADIMQANAPAGSVPRTHNFREMRHDSWDQSKRHLNETFGEDGWLLKPREGSLGSVKDFPTSTWEAGHQTVDAAMRNPGSFIAQEKLPLSGEFRVHTVNGVPVTATNRYAKPGAFRRGWDAVSQRLGLGTGGFAHVPANKQEQAALFEFMNKTHAPFQKDPAFYAENPMHIAYDVGRLPDGSFRLIEANPTPGTLNNPGISRKVISAMTGRKHQDVAAAQAAALGLGVAGGAYAAQEYA